ncbi:MAG: PAS domain-containing protein, partial [Methanobacteriota archaeon]
LLVLITSSLLFYHLLKKNQELQHQGFVEKAALVHELILNVSRASLSDTTYMRTFFNRIKTDTGLDIFLLSPDLFLTTNQNYWKTKRQNLENTLAKHIKEATAKGYSIGELSLTDDSPYPTRVMVYPLREKVYLIIAESTEGFDVYISKLGWGIAVTFILLTVTLLIGFFLIKTHFHFHLNRLAGALKKALPGKSVNIIRNSEFQNLEPLTSSLDQIFSIYEDELQKKHQQIEDYQRMLNSISEGIIILDAQHHMVFCNETARSVLGISPDFSNESYDYQIIRDKHLLTLIDKFFENNTVVSDEIQWGDKQHLEVFITPLKYHPQHGSGAVILFRDITQQKQLEKIRRDFVANVSHEFKTPLAAIRGFAESLLDWGKEDPETLNSYLEKILAQSQHLENLVTDLLQLAQIERLENIDLKPFDPLPILQKVLKEYQSHAHNKQVTLSFQAIAEHSRLLGDPEMFRTILVNLIDNAIKYTSPGGSVQIEMSEEKEHVLISIRDTGIGIPASKLNRIFERFYRVDKSRSRSVPGTGLGLSIV